jgi:hypothetical protein
MEGVGEGGRNDPNIVCIYEWNKIFLKKAKKAGGVVQELECLPTMWGPWVKPPVALKEEEEEEEKKKSLSCWDPVRDT